jgi:hypothetical protein
LKQLREQELRADAWAAEALLRIGQPPNGGMTTLLGSYYARSSAPASLQPRDHPADEERMLALQQATLKNLDRLTAIMARNGRSREATESQLKASISRLEAASKELEQDDPCSKATHGR